MSEIRISIRGGGTVTYDGPKEPLQEVAQDLARADKVAAIPVRPNGRDQRRWLNPANIVEVWVIE